MKMFTIYDTVSETYELPLTMKTSAEMERALSILFSKDPEHRFCAFADSHSLYEIGDFDPHTGTTSIYKERLQISNLSKYKIQ